MEGAPAFFQDDFRGQTLDSVQRPAVAPRRGEWIAWMCTLGAIVGSGLWAARSGSVPALGIGLTVFFALAASLISFGSWVDRNTVIEWGPTRVDYRSPLRRASLRWDEVEAIWAVPTADSWRVGVRGGDQVFAFHTGGKMRFGSSGEMAVGFQGGSSLAATIRRRAELGPPRNESGRWICDGSGVRPNGPVDAVND